MKAYEILTLNGLFNEFENINMDLDTACKIADNISELETPVKLITKKRQEIITKYGEKDENGNIIENPENHEIKILDMNAFRSELDGLMEEEIEIKNLNKITKDFLRELKVTPKTIRILKSVDLIAE